MLSKLVKNNIYPVGWLLILACCNFYIVLDSDEGLLKEWWECFWPQFSSTLANKAGGSSESVAQVFLKFNYMTLNCIVVKHLNYIYVKPLQFDSIIEQPSMHALAMLASAQKQGATSSQHKPVRNSQHNVIRSPVSNQHIFASGDSSVVNAMGQPVSQLRTTPVISQCRAGKLPVNTYFDSILWKSSAQAIQMGPLGHPPAKLLPTQMSSDVNKMAYTAQPPSSNPR